MTVPAGKCCRCLLRYGGSLSAQSCMSVRISQDGERLIALRRKLPPVLYNLHSSVPVFMFDHPGYFNSCTMKSCCFAGDRDQVSDLVTHRNVNVNAGVNAMHYNSPPHWGRVSYQGLCYQSFCLHLMPWRWRLCGFSNAEFIGGGVVLRNDQASQTKCASEGAKS